MNYFLKKRLALMRTPKEELSYLCFTVISTSPGTTEEDTISIYLDNLDEDASDLPLTIYKSTDGINWEFYINNTTQSGEEIELHLGDKIYFKGSGNTAFSDSLSTWYFASTISDNLGLTVSGNIMSLLDEDLTTGLISRSFELLFGSLDTLVDASKLKLPATTLANSCYKEMFSWCTSLTKAPKLPATTLSTSCYREMFTGCTSLTKAPELPATTLASNCYDTMFSGCTSLTKAPKLPATTLSTSCYDTMFSGCTSLTKAPELPATTLATSCYEGMFTGCTSLTEAPELPATSLVSYCYREMFTGCTSLTKAPELYATSIALGSCRSLFDGCSSLNMIKIYFTGNFSTNFRDWVKGVSATGTFYYNGSATTRGKDAIPEGWTVSSF